MRLGNFFDVISINIITFINSTIMRLYILLLILATTVGFSTSSTQAQPTVFELQNGATVLKVTQDIDNKFLGEYQQTRGSIKRQFRINLRLADGKSFFWAPASASETQNLGWLAEQRQPITWGLLTENGELVQTEIHEMVGREMQDFKAFTLVYKTEIDTEYKMLHLYDKNGVIMLGDAIKVGTEIETAKKP